MKKLLYLFGSAMLLLLILPSSSLAFCSDTVPEKYKAAAEDLFETKVLRGSSDGTCKLNDKLNRIEFATLVLRNYYTDEAIVDLADMEGAKGFPDLSKDVWYYKNALAAQQEGLIKGSGTDGKGNFANNINGAELVTIALRGAGVTIPDPLTGEKWYDPAINIANGAGIHVYSPEELVTRGDAVRAIYEINSKLDILDGLSASYGNGANANNTGSTTSSTTSGADITKVVTEFDSMSAEEGARQFRALTTAQKEALEVIAVNFSLFFHNGACESDSSLTISTPLGMLDCSQSAQMLTQAEQQMQSDQNFAQQFQTSVQQEIGMIMVYDLCSKQKYEGEINATNCSSFLSQYEQAKTQYMAQKSAAASAPTYDNSGYTNTYTQPTYSDPNDPFMQGYNSVPDYTSGSTGGYTGGSTGSNQALLNMMSDMNNSYHDTSMRIINNMGGNNCMAGDYGCVPY